VLDASALLAWILDERGADAVFSMLPVAVAPASAMVEALYRSQEEPRASRLSMEELHETLSGLGLAIAPVTDEDTIRAATLIANSRTRHASSGGRIKALSLGDGLCLAVAERLRLTVTGGDQDWAAEDLTITFMPFR
jgi:PIN domain nuclease of toxin-antitoxin system